MARALHLHQQGVFLNMLDPARLPPSPLPATATSPRPKAVFRMVDNDRMAGSVPAWIPADDAAEATAADFTARAQDQAGTAVPSYQSWRTSAVEPDEPFGFGDLLDIINPLQHIPLINTLYRNITGDEIRASSRVLGGMVFGGFAGAAGSLANVILEEETGKDVTQTALGFVLDEKRTAGPPEPKIDLLSEVQQHELPGTALSFVDLAHSPGPKPGKEPAQQWKFNE